MSLRSNTQIILINQTLLQLEDFDHINELLDSVEENGNEALVFDCDAETETGSAGLLDLSKEASRADISYFARWNALLSRIERIKAKTFVVYRNMVGSAGFQLGLSVDIRLMQTHATLQISGLSQGVFPGISMYRLQKFVGLGVARRLLLLNNELDAQAAYQLGLVDQISDNMDQAIDEMLERTQNISAEAASFVRRVVDESYSQDRPASIEQMKAVQFKIGQLLS